ncbi:MAG: OsmC family protein [Acidobacteriota bacterium]|jgi:putative redox protein
MVEMTIEYEGELHCRAVHGPSGTPLSTDAPVDNRGRGESFSPTDLLATSLGVCMMTIIGIRSRDRGIDLTGTRVRVKKEMVADPRRRVGRLGVTFDLPRIDPAERPDLEEAARTCPVALSIHPRIHLDLAFRWGGA